MSTATTESLFLAPIDPKALFTKEATIARMPDDDRKWPEVVLSELHKQLPFLSGMDVALNFTRIAPEAGYGFGHAIVRGQKNAAGLPTPKSENQLVKIPIIVEDRYLQPFHVFLFESRTIPLTQSRFEEALENPRVFAGSDAPPKEEKSLVDQLYPPYQQRQGFGRIVDGTSGMTGSSIGINKVAKANLSPEDFKRLAELKKYEERDKANALRSTKDRLLEHKEITLGSGLAGSAGGAYRALKGGKAMPSVIAQAAAGAGLGMSATGASQAYRAIKERKRNADRKSSKYKEFFKEGEIQDVPNYMDAQTPDSSCKTCKFYSSSTNMGQGFCNKFSAEVAENKTCDDWEVNTTAEKLAEYTKFLMGRRQ
jgi:hypothetical protein